MKTGTTIGILFLFAATLTAGVPNRIIYQGRLFKSGVGISGEKSIRLTLVKADGKTVVDTKSFSVSLPATGEFTIVWDLEKEIDWRGDQPELKVEVDTDELTPRQQFSASPYAFVAKRVEVGAVDTLSIADGAVTSAKISAGGIEAEKINLANGKTLNSWVAPNGKIMADGIEGELKTTANHATKHEKGGEDELRLDPSQVDGVLVAHSTYTQVIQPTANEPALAVKGNPRSGSDVLQIYDSGDTPVKQVSFDKDGNMVSNRALSAASIVSSGALTADLATVKRGLLSLFEDATTKHSASLQWNSLQLGNNGWNYIVAGRTGVGGGFKFFVNNINDYQHPGGPNGKEAMTIDSNGRVGIGTSSPSESLEVAGGNLKVLGGIVASDLSLAGDITSSSVNATGESILAANSGNVGIGTKSPKAKLDVNGPIKFNSQKFCRATVPGMFSFSTLVPSSWTSGTCSNFMTSAGGLQFQLGCIFENSFSIGTSGGGIPNPNCGW